MRTDAAPAPSAVTPAAGKRRLHVLRDDLRAILGDGATFSIMVGIGESYVAAFVLALGMGEVAAGLVATLPMLAGAALQLLSPWAVRRLGSHRRWVVACAVVQAASLLMLPVVAFWGAKIGWLVYVAATLYWGAGLATGPAWNAWIEELVPRSVRARFFAARVRVSQAGVLAGFVTGGLLLQWGSASTSREMLVFASLFLVAATCRFASAGFLFHQSEPSAGRVQETHVGLRQMTRRMRGHAGTALLVFLLAMQAGVQIAGPYFAPYMLKQLEFSYFQYMVLIGVAFVSRVLALPALGKFAKVAGARRLLWIGSIGIVPLSALWLVSSDFYWLLFVQFVCGIVWGAYELAMFLMFFETIPREERTSLLTVFNLGNAGAMAVGALLGALLLRVIGPGQEAYLMMFWISSAVRLGTLVLLARVPDVSFEPESPATHVLAVRPQSGVIERPILPSMPNGVETERPTTPEG
jgi:MFS family permease